MRLGGVAVAFIWPCGGEGPEKLVFRWLSSYVFAASKDCTRAFGFYWLTALFNRVREAL